MFFSLPGKPTKFKKFIYLIASTILGLLLSFLLHALIEMNYLSWAQNREIAVSFYGNCALSPLLQITLLALGVVGGLMLGRLWWRLVYVDRIWEKKTK